MARYAPSERSAVADTLLRVGPDSPTLCEGWVARDLAVHLIVRDRRPDAAAGMLVSPLRPHAQRVKDGLAAQPWEQTVQVIRTGPPRLSPFAIPAVNELANLVEYFVHHEDLLRAGADPQRRELDPGLEGALWGSLPRIARLTLRSVPTGVVADCPGYGRRALRPGKGSHGSVVLTGAPGDVLLAMFGRGAAADVGYDGADRDVAAFRAAKLGF